MKLLRYLVSVALLLAAMSCADGGKMIILSISPASNAVIAEGKTQQFQATAVFSDGTVIPWTTAATWTITPAEGGATIGNAFGTYGLVTSTSGTGDFTVKATDVANGISSPEVVLHVRRPDINITPANAYMPLNSSHQFTATGTLLISEGTSTMVDLTSSVTWTTAPPTGGSASVDSDGLVTSSPTTTGPTDLIANYIISGVTVTTGATRITVTDSEVQTISIASPAGFSVPPGDTLTLTATGHYADPSFTSDLTKSVDWKSSDTSVATINQGLLSATTKTGATTITAEDPISKTLSNPIAIDVW